MVRRVATRPLGSGSGREAAVNAMLPLSSRSLAGLLAAQKTQRRVRARPRQCRYATAIQGAPRCARPPHFVRRSPVVTANEASAAVSVA
jgi:hypothetical protein